MPRRRPQLSSRPRPFPRLVPTSDPLTADDAADETPDCTDLDTDPLAEAVQAYAWNLFVSTRLRRLEWPTLSTLEDAHIVQAWAREAPCARCRKGDDLQGSPPPPDIRQHLRDALLVRGGPREVVAPGAPVRGNLQFVAGLLGLDAPDAAVLQFLCLLHRTERLQEVANATGELTLPEAHKVIAAATRLSQARVGQCLAPSGRLRESGLVVVDPDRGRLVAKIGVLSKLVDLLDHASLDRDTFLRAFLEPAPRSSLERDDFPDREAVDTAMGLVRAAAASRARGVNLLFHGSTGVGKTELARLIGQQLGLQVLVVGKADCNGDSATAGERLSALRVALQLAPRGESLLLFDELEDLFRWELDSIFGSRAAQSMSKQWFGSLLEENAIPIVWCTNRIEGIDPAFLRRFSFMIELKPAGARQRARVLSRHLGPDAALAASDVDAIAQRFAVSPAQLATAVRSARLVAPGGAPDRATLERFLAPVHKAITGEDATLKQVFDAGRYRLDVLCCREDLGALAEQVSGFTPGGGPGISLCLYGPPGTGKSEFVKYLAWRAGLPLVYRRVSDLVSPFVGQTERNIAAAFEEARQDGALLLFDEADSFLRERRHAVRSWEVTQVNEFLQQLESFPGICACTTNLPGELDQASLRRFVFKLEFQYLRPEQSVALFATTFPWTASATADVEDALRQLRRLTPGDLAAASRRIAALRIQPPAVALVRMLADEVALKADGARPIGF